MTYDAKDDWHKIYGGGSLAYPAEGVIRIFKGQFPRLTMPRPTAGKILDVGFGDGRHFPLFATVGLTGYGIEISDAICDLARERLTAIDVPFAEVKTGSSDAIPYPDGFFDYLLSWNTCYYMSFRAKAGVMDFRNNVSEMARVLKKDRWLVCSIPKKTCFVYKDSRPTDRDGYRAIARDPWGHREGEVMRCFESFDEIRSDFGAGFGDFQYADIEMDWFGLAYHWHVFVARRT